VVVAQLSAIIGAIFSVRILTEYLEPAEYGRLALGLTIGGLVNLVVTNGISAGIQRYYSIAIEGNDLKGYFDGAKYLLFISTIIILAISLLLIAILSLVGMSGWIPISALALLHSSFYSIYLTLNGIQSAARKRANVAIHVAGDAILRILLSILFIRLFGSSGASVIIAYALAAFMLTVSQLYFLRDLFLENRNNNKPAIAENWINRIWNFSWPLSFPGLFIWLQQASDRWALERFTTTAEVGQYVVLFQLGYTPIGMIVGLVTGIIVPIIFQRSGSVTDVERNASVHKISWYIALSGLFLTAFCFSVSWISHDWLFYWLVAEPFRSISYMLPWIVLAGGLFASAQIFTFKLMSELRTKAQLAAKIITAVVGVSANILGAFWFGIEGVLGALVIFSGFYFLWMAKLAKNLPTASIE